jgi:probable phosphoglycerate mutase
MLLHFIRHGESIWHSQNRYAGVTDIDLSREGRNQSEQFAELLEKDRVSKIFSSGLSRAIDTAKPTSLSLGIDLVIDSRLNEVDFGDVEGLTPIEWENRFPVNREEFLEKPATVVFPNGGSGEASLGKANEFLRELVIGHENKSGEVLLFCHGTLMRLILCSMLGIDINSYRRVFPNISNGLSTSVEILHLGSNMKLSGSILALNYPGLIPKH